MSTPNPNNTQISADLLKQVRTREVAVAELSNLSSARAVYQKNGNIYFQTTIEKATAFEQKQLDIAKGRLQMLG
ncbi:Prefoldin chaperone subunit family protein [Striga hermonthica]|uniref:Prefoldin chaperone subunit family protein n=1 Tax=Striga hermonthica TaxID=68872 RepID=A0A9N7N5F2_STRHE|nr:Prefoldin chaperone subunit family protein [Striga hermonthica]